MSVTTASQSRPARRARSRAGGRAVVKAAEGPTLTERAYLALEELITTLQLPPGAFLSEMALADRLGFGRTPIREALQRLARDGLVVVAPRRGILVSEINLKTQLRLLETRRVLEALLARLAAERSDAAERARFAEIAAEMRAAADASDDLAFMRLDRDFNELVSKAARNEFATRSIATMAALSRRFWYQHYREVGDLGLSARLHAEVAEAIATRDGAAAATASDSLMDYIENFARKTLDL
ncbi:GntR family transcriptional regulator [Chenggangzhangella methanolivorans]|uniref:GntR family transcriptional regulator n=1 Tax=Chenggangzhangella methanolivorans TaxID=1437009 RepID=A0A9E6RC00_9HYPH|nr:GntR family transcriptional regulator [Chenggangzhangella methanolivorans]QZO01452.1 GntR family transcriptional regulator [Chenggangzhangella methanolivorans]